MFHEQRRRWGETAVARQGEWGEWATMAASGAVDGGTKPYARRAEFFAPPGSSPYRVLRPTKSFRSGLFLSLEIDESL
jgi:hypothetical protein